MFWFGFVLHFHSKGRDLLHFWDFWHHIVFLLHILHISIALINTFSYIESVRSKILELLPIFDLWLRLSLWTLSRVLLWIRVLRVLGIAMFRDGTRRINRRMRYSAHLEVILMVSVELFPVFNTLA